MSDLLIFFALPIATIIISIALQKIFKCPYLVAAIIFAIFLVVTFVIGDLIFLVATIIYTIIAFVTAYLTMIISRLGSFGCRRCDSDTDANNNCQSSENSNNTNNRISVRANVVPNGNGGGFYGCYRRR